MSLIRKQKTLKIGDRLEPVKTAAERLGRSYDTVIRMIGRGELRATTTKPIMVNKADVDAQIRQMFKEAGVVELV